MIGVLIVLTVVLSFGTGFGAGHRRASKDRPESDALTQLRLGEHARLLTEARDAQLRGELGVAESLTEAAQRVLAKEE